jgi:hypothetical protein
MVTFHTCQVDINKRLAPHFLDTHTCSLSYEASCNWKLGEEKKGGASLGEDFMYWFELSLEHCISHL